MASPRSAGFAPPHRAGVASPSSAAGRTDATNPRSPVVSRRWAIPDDAVSSSDDDGGVAASPAEREQRLASVLPRESLEHPLYCLSGPWAVQQQLHGVPSGLRYRIELRHEPPHVRGRADVPHTAPSPWRQDMRVSLYGSSSVSNPVVHFSLGFEPAEPVGGMARRRGAKPEEWRLDCAVVVDRTGNYFAGTYQTTAGAAGRGSLSAGAITAARLPRGESPSYVIWPPRPCGESALMICERPQPLSPPPPGGGAVAATPPAGGAPPPAADDAPEADAAPAPAPPAVPTPPAGPPSGRPTNQKRLSDPAAGTAGGE